MALRNVEVLVPLSSFQEYDHGGEVWTSLPKGDTPLDPGDRAFWSLGHNLSGTLVIVEIDRENGRCKIRKLD